jgi:hypothetical protein
MRSTQTTSFRTPAVFCLILFVIGLAGQASARAPMGAPTVATQSVSVSPIALSFGIPTGTPAPLSLTNIVTVNISGEGGVTLSGFVISGGTNPADFTFNGNSCLAAQTAPTTCQIGIEFTSTQPAGTLETATLSFTSSTQDSPVTVPLSGAYGAIKLFDETDITSNNSPYTIATKQLNLTCPETPTATISGTPDGKGYVLVDNYLTLQTGPSLTPVNSATPLGNICSGTGSIAESGATDCFTFNYEDYVFGLPDPVPSGLDPDNFANPGNGILKDDDPKNGAGGVPPIAISSFVGGPYPEQALFTLLSSGDEGVYDNTTLFLQTNCTAPGIVPGASVTLNPIDTNNPATLTQTAELDNSPNQNISFTTSSSVASQQEPNLLVNGVVQVITDYPVPQQLFNQLIAGTSAGPAVCMRMTGEQDSQGNPMCKGFLLQCYTPGASGAAGTPSGDNCYNPSALTEQAQRYLLFTGQFASPDGPSGYNYLTTQPWVANQTTGYALGQTIVDNSGYVQQVTTAGQTGSGYPFTASSETVGAVTPDGGVSWTNEGVNACFNVGQTANPATTSICAQGTGPALLMGGDNWLCPTDSPCTPPTTSVSTSTPTIPPTYNVASCAFDSAGGLNGDLCPLDAMTSFLGAADPASKGTAKISNSIFFPVVNQPLPTATETPSTGFTGSWTNSPSTATVSFNANPAAYAGSGTAPAANGFSAASIYSVTGGLTAFGTPLPDTTYPVAGDYSLFNTGTSPTSPFCTSTPGGTFTGSASLTNLDQGNTPADGIYNLHYFTTDCALTEGLVYSPTTLQVTDPTANWASFPFAALGVDTVAPTASCSQTPASPTYGPWYGMNVTENCSVTDQDFNSNLQIGPITGSGFAPPINGIQGSQSENVSASTTVAPGSVNSNASIGAPTPAPCDQAGNCAAIPGGPFAVDLQAPALSGSAGNSTVGGTPITVTYTCNDGAGSGVPSGGCTITGTPANFISTGCSPASGASVTCGGTIPTTMAESGTMYANATDNVGNQATAFPIAYSVGAATPVITFNTLPTPTYLGGNFIVSATTTNTDSPTLTYSYVSGPCVLVNGATGTFNSTGAGTCVVQANGVATPNFTSATKTANVIIGPATPVITFGAAPSPTYPGANFTVHATTTNTDSSALTYSYVSGPCSLVSASAGTFSPTGVGTCVVQASGVATKNFTAASNTQNVGISSGAWTISPSPYNFGSLSVGQTASQQFTITNPSANTVAITVSIPENGYGDSGGSQPVGDPDDFHITANGCTAPLGAGKSCQVTVTYGADQDDFHGVYAYLTVSSGKTVLVKAEMLAKAVDPTVKMSTNSFNFGTQPTGSPVTDQVLTLTNNGPTTWLIHGLTLNGSAAFKIASGASQCMKGSLAPSASCNVYVTFTPAKKGTSYSGSICINGNEANGPLNLSLKGMGGAAP